MPFPSPVRFRHPFVLVGMLIGLFLLETGAQESRSVAGQKTASARQVLPGLVPSPKELPGGLRWQIFTKRPRSAMTCFDLSRDGTRAAFGDGAIVRIYDTQGFVLRQILVGHQKRVRSLAFSPDGAHIATASDDGTARIWTATAKPVAELRGRDEAMLAVAWSPSGKQLAVAGHDGIVRLCTGQGEPGKEIVNSEAPATCVAFSPDGARLVVGDDDRIVRIWNVDGTLIAKCEGHKGGMLSVDWSSDGKLIASAGVGYAPQDGGGNAMESVRLWDADGRFVRALDGHRDPVSCVRFSPDGSCIVSTSEDFTIREWTTAGELKGILRGDKDGTIRWLPDGKRFYFAGSGRIMILDPRNDQAGGGGLQSEEDRDRRARETGLLVEKTLRVERTVWNPDGKTFAVLPLSGRLHLFDAAGHAKWAVKMERTPTFNVDVAWNPAGTELLATGSGPAAPIYNRDGKEVRHIDAPNQVLRFAKWSPDGKSILGCDFQQAFLLSPQGQAGAVFPGHRGRIESLAWRPDSKQFATASSDSTVRIWNVDGKGVKVLQGFASDADSVAWNPDAKWIAVGMDDGSWKLWTPEGVEGPTQAGIHQTSIAAIAFSPDGRFVATGGWDGNVALWKSQGGEPICVLAEHVAPVACVSWSPDGKRLLSASRDNTARIWNTETHKCETVVLTLTDGTTATFNAAGDLVDGKPQSLEKDVEYLTEKPGGAFELIPYAKFKDRAQQAD